MHSLEKLIGVVFMLFRLRCVISVGFNLCVGLNILSQQQRSGNRMYSGTALQRFCMTLLNQRTNESGNLQAAATTTEVHH